MYILWGSGGREKQVGNKSIVNILKSGPDIKSYVTVKSYALIYTK